MITRQSFAPLGWVIGVVCGLGALEAAHPADSPSTDPSPEVILRRTTEFYAQIPAFSVEVAREQQLGPNATYAVLSVALERPNKLAIRPAGDGAYPLMVSDGRTLTVSIPHQGARTVQSQAPATLAGMWGKPEAPGTWNGLLDSTLLAELTGAEPYQTLMERVTSSTYVGAERLDDAKVHHLKFTQDRFDWEVWIAAEGDPLLLRSTLDLTKLMTAGRPALAVFLRGQKFASVTTFRAWKVGPVAAQTFVFQPSPGGQPATDPAVLVGKEAPDIRLDMLDGGWFRLQDHRDQDVVLISFWSAWCPPDVLDLPVLTALAASYKDKGFRFVAINLGDGDAQIVRFLATNKLDFPIALDINGATRQPYHATSFPMLVLIDKQGMVRSVHVSPDPALRANLTREIDALLTGKELASQVPDQPKPVAVAAEVPDLEPVWSVGEPYVGVATGPKGRSAYAVHLQGRCDVIDAAGTMTQTFPVEGVQGGTSVRCARGPGGTERVFLFRLWGPTVTVFRGDGIKLWEEENADGVDDVCAADLDGDGLDEAIIGYNGSFGGLNVFSPEGERLWKRPREANVWNVASGDLDGDGKPEVVSTSAQGQIHVFAASDGAPLNTLEPGVHATKVRVVPGRARPPAKGDLILAAGMQSLTKGEALVALGGDGKIVWTTNLQTKASLCLAVSPDGTLAALGFQGGGVAVVDVATGQILSRVANQGFAPSVAWVTRGEGGGENLLLVATQKAINAFRMKMAAPGAPAAAARP